MMIIPTNLLIFAFYFLVSTRKIDDSNNDVCQRCCDQLSRIFNINSELSEIISYLFHESHKSCIVKEDAIEVSDETIKESLRNYIKNLLYFSLFRPNTEIDCTILFSEEDFKYVFKDLFKDQLDEFFFHLIVNFLYRNMDERIDFEIIQNYFNIVGSSFNLICSANYKPEQIKNLMNLNNSAKSEDIHKII